MKHIHCFLHYMTEAYYISTVAGTVMDVVPSDGSTVSWSPPDPPNGMIIYYNIRITHVDSGEVEQFIEVFFDTSIDISYHVDSNGDYSVQVHYVHEQSST